MRTRTRGRRWTGRMGALSLLTTLAALVPSPATASPAPPAARPPAAVPDQLLVGYRASSTPGQWAQARRRGQAAVVDRVVPGRAGTGQVELVQLPAGADRDQAARRILQDPAVAYAEPNWLVTPAATAGDPYFVDGTLWGMEGAHTSPSNQYGSHAAEAWAAGRTGSADVYVGVIDEGVQYNHPDLAGQVWSNPFDPADGVDNDGNGFVDDIRGWDFANKDNTVYDGGTSGRVDKHGTHVAGTIGARSNGAGVVGVNWDVRLIPAKFLGRNGGTTANAVKAIDYLTDLKARHGLNIVATNNSWSGGGFSQALLDAITRAARRDILFVAAAGNSGTDNDATPGYPSGYDTSAGAGFDAVVAVAAIDATGKLAGFSQYGAASVDLGAPGVGIMSTVAGSGYASYSGTSMATPHVTGGAALYAAGHPGAGAAAIRSVILASTAPTPSLAGRTASGGRLDLSSF